MAFDPVTEYAGIELAAALSCNLFESITQVQNPIRPRYPAYRRAGRQRQPQKGQCNKQRSNASPAVLTGVFFCDAYVKLAPELAYASDAPPRNITASGDHTVPELRAVLFIGRAELVEISLACGLYTRTVGDHATGPDDILKPIPSATIPLIERSVTDICRLLGDATCSPCLNLSGCYLRRRPPNTAITTRKWCSAKANH